MGLPPVGVAAFGLWLAACGAGSGWSGPPQVAEQPQIVEAIRRYYESNAAEQNNACSALSMSVTRIDVVSDSPDTLVLDVSSVSEDVRWNLYRENQLLRQRWHWYRFVGLDGPWCFAADGPPIIEAALTVRSDAPYACKGGVCGTCRAKLVEGTVRMDTNYALEPDEVERGYVLTCQSHPTSERVVLDYDA